MSTGRPMLANITAQADSAHNVKAKAEETAAAGGAPQKDFTYFQQQYHSALLSEPIHRHNKFVAEQQKQPAPSSTVAEQAPVDAEASVPPAQAPAEAPATPNTSANRRANRDGRPSRRTPKSEGRPSRGSAPAPSQSMAHPNHEDVDGYPCPCPDCGMRRLDEMRGGGAGAGMPPMTEEEMHLHMQQQFHQQQQQQAMHHHGGYPQDAIAYDYYGNPMPMHAAMMQQYGAAAAEPQSPVQQQQQQNGRPRSTSPNGTYRHSPYAVGYSPNTGYGFDMPPGSMPSSPVYAAPDAAAASFDVPYVPPPQADYSRFAQDTPSGSHSEEDGVPTPAAPAKKGGRHQAPPQQQQDRRPRAQLQSDAPAAPAADEAPAARGGRSQQQPQQQQRGVNGRRSSPDQASSPSASEGRSSRRNSPAAPEPRPECPFALKIRTSQWHVKAVLSPVEYGVDACVIFEGDRGKDAGIVVDCGPNMVDANTTGRQTPMALALGSEEDATMFASQEADAAATVDTARTLVEKLKLPMTVVGAVYQHDRQKLTFMYEASERVDFRQLLRELYTEFRCRIWMEVPPGSHNPASTSRRERRKEGRQQEEKA